jgi:hypothetical protein
MFSTVDTRALRAWRIDRSGEHPIELPRHLLDAVDRCEALPSAACVHALARDLAAADPLEADAAVRVEVWETRFDPAMRPLPRRLRTATFDARSTPR